MGGSAGAICCSVVDDDDDDDEEEDVEVGDVADSALSPPFFWLCSSFADVAVFAGEHCSSAGPRCTQENRV